MTIFEFRRRWPQARVVIVYWEVPNGKPERAWITVTFPGPAIGNEYGDITDKTVEESLDGFDRVITTDRGAPDGERG